MPYRGSGVKCGHAKKDGTVCGYIIYPPATACLHHSKDRTRQNEVLEKARRAAKESSAPEIETNGFQTLDDCLRVRALVVQELCAKPRPNYRALEMVLKAASGASADHAVKATERTNELLMMLDGHSAGVAALRRLQESPLRVLPGKQRVLDLSKVIEGKASTNKQAEAYPTNESDSSDEPKGGA